MSTLRGVHDEQNEREEREEREERGEREVCGEPTVCGASGAVKSLAHWELLRHHSARITSLCFRWGERKEGD